MTFWDMLTIIGLFLAGFLGISKQLDEIKEKLNREDK